MKLGLDQLHKSVGQLILGLIIFFLIFYLFIYLYTIPYRKNVIYVQVKDAVVFEKPLNSSDPQILDFGRKPKNEISAIDRDIDNEDGPDSGKLRWYVCGGIDCDEGWQHRFYKK
ncbi:MAG: hypothetical protein PVG96_10240 [Desulfobacterales bacterium]|jgi:hypothetical protein